MDYQTLFTILVSTLLIQSIALTLTWRQNRNEIGLRDWAVACALMALGSLLSAYGLNVEQTQPDMSIALRILASTAAIAGWFMVWIGARRFYGRPALKYSTLAFIMLLTTAALTIRLDQSWRIVLSSGGIALLSALSLKEFLGRTLLRNLTLLFMVATLFLTSVVWALRAVAHLNASTSISLIDSLALYDAIVASLALTLSMIVLTNERIHQQLRNQAGKDPLTGTMNRRAFYEASAPLLATLQRDASKLAVCLIDIDNFKRINDSHGHDVGDEVLKQFARMAQATLREGDLFARHGGEEFAVLLHNNDPQQAEQAIERLRNTLSTQGIALATGRLDVTFSAGISHASGPATVSLDAMLKAADISMYRAKDAGRDRTVVFNEDLHAGQPADVMEKSGFARISEANEMG